MQSIEIRILGVPNTIPRIIVDVIVFAVSLKAGSFTMGSRFQNLAHSLSRQIPINHTPAITAPRFHLIELLNRANC